MTPADATPGDGRCATCDGTCTLRAAVEECNKSNKQNTILIPAGRYLLTHGRLSITTPVAIVGAGERKTVLAVDGARNALLFDPARIFVEGATLQNWRPA